MQTSSELNLRAMTARRPSDDSERSNARVPLTRQRVLTAALRLVDAEGLDALSGRRFGQELGRDAMTLYRYAPDQAALLDGIVELVLAELIIPDDGEDWQTQLRRGAHSFRRLALAHPHVVGLIVTRPIATPLGLRPLGTLKPLENLLQMLHRRRIQQRSGFAHLPHLQRSPLRAHPQ